MSEKKKSKNIRRTLHYFWMAMMQYKVRTLLLFLAIPAWVFIYSVVVPYGTSRIIGNLSAGDFELQNYAGILLLTLASSAVNTIFPDAAPGDAGSAEPISFAFFNAAVSNVGCNN